MAPLALVAPGGGLKQLDLTDPGFTFDSIYLDSIEPESEISKLPQKLVRVYSSDQDM